MTIPDTTQILALPDQLEHCVAADQESQFLDFKRWMVREYWSNHQKIMNAELRELLGLGDSPSAQVEASRYLKKWSQADGFLDKVTGGGVHYVPRKTI